MLPDHDIFCVSKFYNFVKIKTVLAHRGAHFILFCHNTLTQYKIQQEVAFLFRHVSKVQASKDSESGGRPSSPIDGSSSSPTGSDDSSSTSKRSPRFADVLLLLF